MSAQVSGTSSIKLGFLVAWPAFWTGFPFKLVICLLLLSAGLHPWGSAGLAFLLLLSIPIDIWALGLAARTVFLERLRIEPPRSLGMTLWWQGALLSAVFLPILYVGVSGAVAGAKAGTHIILTLFEPIPIAEKIGIELVMWGGVATVVLIALILGWLQLFGLLVRRQATAGERTSESYQALIRRWDLFRIPADQPLVLTVFIGAGVFLVLCFWAFMPVLTPHPHEDYEMPTKIVKPLRPAEALDRAEQVLRQAEATVKSLEKKSRRSPGGKAKKTAGKNAG